MEAVGDLLFKVVLDAREDLLSRVLAGHVVAGALASDWVILLKDGGGVAVLNGDRHVAVARPLHDHVKLVALVALVHEERVLWVEFILQRVGKL